MSVMMSKLSTYLFLVLCDTTLNVMNAIFMRYNLFIVKVT